MSWDEEIDLWVLDRRLNAGWKPKTTATRESLARHMAETLGGDPQDVTPSRLRRHLLDEYTRRRGGGPATYYNSLKSFWDWCSAEYGEPSPMAGVRRPEDHVARTPILKPVQLQAIREATEGRSFQRLRDRLIVQMLAGTGIRRSELCGITLADLTEDRSVATVRGKAGQRVVFLGDATRLALMRYLNARGKRSVSTDVLLVSHRGGPLTAEGLSGILYRLGGRAGVPGLRAHLFRHLWAHRAQAAGMGLTEILTLGGWSSSQQLTTRYGAALREERAIEAARRTMLDAL